MSKPLERLAEVLNTEVSRLPDLDAVTADNIERLGRLIEQNRQNRIDDLNSALQEASNILPGPLRKMITRQFKKA